MAIDDPIRALEQQFEMEDLSSSPVTKKVLPSMHEKGATRAQAQAQLGHASMQMTVQYTHVLESGREHIEAIGRDFSAIKLTGGTQ